eukprot:11200024-Lingulodinium_polyedra.AAC.1
MGPSIAVHGVRFHGDPIAVHGGPVVFAISGELRGPDERGGVPAPRGVHGASGHPDPRAEAFEERATQAGGRA